MMQLASMDSASFFSDKSLGAESPISGLNSLLAAVDALSRMDGLNGLSKQAFKANSYDWLTNTENLNYMIDGCMLNDPQDSDDPKQSTADMTVFVQNLLQQMQSRFQTMSESIIAKIDEMGNRIDDLEQSINDLKVEIGAEGSPSPSAPRIKSDPKSPTG